MAAVAGTVYLLHFDRPFSHARHYTGWARDLKTRLAQHAAGNGARLLAAVAEAGISWELAWTWPGTRQLERKLKRQGGASRHCPLCGVKPRRGGLPRNRDGLISRSLTTGAQKAAAGLMTTAGLAAHTALRAGAARGRVPGIVRLGPTPPDDPWYAPPPAPPRNGARRDPAAAGEMAS